jgi:hypothetical protein
MHYHTFKIKIGFLGNDKIVSELFRASWRISQSYKKEQEEEAAGPLKKQ